MNFWVQQGQGRAPNRLRNPHSSEEDTPFPSKAQQAAAASRGGRHPSPGLPTRVEPSWAASPGPGAPRPGVLRRAQEAPPGGRLGPVPGSKPLLLPRGHEDQAGFEAFGAFLVWS